MTTLQATRRDWNTVKEAARDWVREFDARTLAIFLFAVFVTVVLILAPWVFDNSDLLWR